MHRQHSLPQWMKGSYSLLELIKLLLDYIACTGQDTFLYMSGVLRKYCFLLLGKNKGTDQLLYCAC